MVGLIIVFIIAITIFSSNAKKAAQQANKEKLPPTPSADIPKDDGKWYDDEYYGEGLPPSKDVCDPRGSHGSHKPTAQVSVPEPKQNTREAPKATIKTSFKAAVSENTEKNSPASIEVAGTDLSFTGDSALRAVLYSEILAKPKALR